MESNKLFIFLWLIGCIFVALAMEMVKLSGKRHKFIWWLYGAILTIIMTTSVWFGVDGHQGTIWLLPALYIIGYVLQLVIDTFGAKKLFLKIVNAYLKKHGYAKLEE